MYTRYTNPDFFNHIYLSIYSLLSCILVLQYKLFSKKLRWLIIIYILIHLFILGSRACIISIIIAVLIYLIFSSFVNKKHFKYLLIFLTSLTLLASLTYIFKNTLLFNRYSQVFEWYNKKDIILEKNWSINNRLKIYILGTSSIQNPNYIGINGTGIAEHKIKEEYELNYKTNFPFITDTYHTHNQFINNYLDWGITGVFLLCALLFLILKKTFKQKQLWVSYFWLCFAILLMMENMLIRQRGIMLFILFYALFISTNTSSTKQIENE
ncbi:O-antigen ligase family protein [Galbibacter sp. EGI 63066]|uniref:O-antigen ligase family protein n=1 Tax=Galbibacter sp. EGI 63066 TaxID=2993559 RepID=UPI003A520B88